jgi:hypothetical protein
LREGIYHLTDHLACSILESYRTIQIFVFFHHDTGKSLRC